MYKIILQTETGFLLSKGLDVNTLIFLDSEIQE